MTTPERESEEHRHGNVFGRGSGDMFVHVRRASGLAHQTMVFGPWQVQALRLIASRWFAAVLAIAIASWGYFAFQTARVPLLTQRITHLERDAAKIDTLQTALEQLQKRYDQVQQMLSASTRAAPAVAKSPPKPGSTASKASKTTAH